MIVDKKIPINKLGRFTQTERDLVGIKIHKLTAIKRVRLCKGKEKAFRWYWECLCECGNKVTILEYSFYSGNTKSCGCAMKGNNAKPFGVASSNTHYYRYKLFAKKRNIQFSLSREEFDYLTSQSCHYCGSEPVEKVFQKNINGNIIANGIDRVDSGQSYLLKNCVPCCSHCNMAKKELTVDEFLNLIKKIYMHNKLDQI